MPEITLAEDNLRATEPFRYATGSVDMSDLHVVLAEYDRRGAVLAAVAALHEPYTDGAAAGWTGGGGYGPVSPACASCGTPDEYAAAWPCATARAIDATYQPAGAERDAHATALAPPPGVPPGPWVARDSRVLDATGAELFLVHIATGWRQDVVAGWVVDVVNRALAAEAPAPVAATPPEGLRRALELADSLAPCRCGHDSEDHGSDPGRPCGWSVGDGIGTVRCGCDGMDPAISVARVRALLAGGDRS